MPKIVLIGAGSASFGPAMLHDLRAHAGDLRGSEVWLVDVNAESLEAMAAYAARVFADCDAVAVRSATDRRAALPGADFVIVSVAVDRLAAWRLDWNIPLRHGVRHVLGENGGPGGLSHALRNIPLLLDIARDVESLAPGALLFNFTNPLSRLCLALHRHTRVRFVGLCHQIGEGYRLVNEVLGLVDKREFHAGGSGLAQVSDPGRQGFDAAGYQAALEARYHLFAAGLNHFSFILGLRDRVTGEDVYPAFRERVRRMPATFELMSRRLMDAFGLFCATGDGHAGEYVGFAAETLPLTGYDFDGYAARSRAQWDDVRAVGEGRAVPHVRPSGERAVPIIAALHIGRAQPELSVNVVNAGCIENLPRDAVVEIPAVVDGAGIHGVHVGALPRGLASMMRREIDIQELVVEAAVSRSRRAALQALLLDPTVHSHAQAEHVLDDLLAAHATRLPSFA